MSDTPTTNHTMKHTTLAIATLLLGACQSTELDNGVSQPKTLNPGSPGANPVAEGLEQSTGQVQDAIQAGAKEASAAVDRTQDEFNRLRRDMGLEPVEVETNLPKDVAEAKPNTAGLNGAVEAAADEVNAAAKNAEEWALNKGKAAEAKLDGAIQDAKDDLLKAKPEDVDLKGANPDALDLPSIKDVEPVIQDMELSEAEIRELEAAGKLPPLPIEEATPEEMKAIEGVMDQGVPAADANQMDKTELDRVVEASTPAPKADEIPNAMSIEDMEARMRQLATPGAEHTVLNPLEGTFQATVELWMAPGAKPELSTGTSINTWALGQRFMQTTYTGQFMGEVFHGFGHLGFDKVRGQYVGYWVDSMGTQMMNISTGQASLDGKSITLRRVTKDAITGKDVEMKEVLNIKNENQHEWEMWGHAPDGTYYRQARIAYTRQK